MNEIQRLIHEMCPDGVPMVALGEIASIYDGTHQTPKYSSSGIKFVSVENIDNLYTSDKYISKEDFEKNYKYKPQVGDILMTRIGSVGRCAIVDKEEPIAFYVSLSLIRPCLDKIINKYLKYIIESRHGEKELRKRTLLTAVPLKINLNDVGKIQIPLPPLPIQQRIVEILDKFTSLVSSLDSEIALRQKQYEYYRDKLYGESIEELLKNEAEGNYSLKSISELGTITRGKRFTREDVVENGVPALHYGDMYTYYGLSADKANTHLTAEKASKMRFCKTGDVVIVGAGENDWDIGVGVVWLGNEKAAVHDACYILEHNQNPMYISHFLRSNVYHLQLRKYVSDAKICSFSAKDLGRIIIPIPSLDRQLSIVRTLDTFESLLTNLKKERELRQKQYEYYREKLLTFA